MGAMTSVDYLSETEARAVRCNAFGLADRSYNHDDMTFSIRDPDSGEMQRIPRQTVQRFMEDWKVSGRWSLHGRPDA